MTLPIPVALYMRVSTEDQAERSTIETQRAFLQAFATLFDLPIANIYADEGISGVIPLRQRPAGQQLLRDAQARRFGVVLVYRVDRLGRSLAALLDAYAMLRPLGVTIRSATEPFNTATPIGMFLFQLLSSLAELERAIMQERLTLGKARVARRGKWLGAPIPFGYDLTPEGRLTPSTRFLDPLGMTEADAARDLFVRIAHGSTLGAECRRLNALGVLSTRRYRTQDDGQQAAAWGIGRLWKMMHNATYCGRHVYHSRHGAITREVPALISPALWEQVQHQLTQNKGRAKGDTQRPSLLRGLLVCGMCGRRYVAALERHGAWTGAYYRCGSFRTSMPGAPRPRPCRGKKIPARQIEDAVWAACRTLILDPEGRWPRGAPSSRSSMRIQNGSTKRVPEWQPYWPKRLANAHASSRGAAAGR